MSISGMYVNWRLIHRFVRWFVFLIIVMVFQDHSWSSMLTAQSQYSSDTIVGLDVSPIAPQYAIIRYDGAIEIMNYDTNQVEQSFLVEIPFQDLTMLNLFALEVRQISYSPTGNLIAISLADSGNSGLIYIVDMQSGEIRLAHNQPFIRCINDMSWSPDGTRIVLSLSDGVLDQTIFSSVEILDIITGEFETVITENVGRIPLAVAWNQTNVIAYAVDTELILWDASSETEIDTFTVESNIHELAWSPDSSRLASLAYDRSIRVWDTNSLQVSFRMNSTEYREAILRWINTTTLVGSVFTDVEIWDVEAREIIEIIETGTFIFGVGIISDEEIIYAGPTEVITHSLQNDIE